MDEHAPDNPGGRVLAVDYGRRRVGLAISDPTGTIATGMETLIIKSAEEAATRIATERDNWEYQRIVVGLPLRTSGEPSEMADEVLQFVERLRELCGVPVETIDERFSSHEAQRILHATGRRVKGNKAAIDRLAAGILLRQYLDMHPRSAGGDDQ